MNEVEKKLLFAALENASWKWDGDTLFAPRGTTGFHRRFPWTGDLRSLRDRMIGRRDRIRQRLVSMPEYAKETEEALADTDGLVRILDALVARDVDDE